MEERELVIALIADHLRFTSVILNLENTGFITSTYYPQLGKTIMAVMKIKSSVVLMYYLALIESCCAEKRDLKEDSEDLYNDLVWMREEFHNLLSD